jgi:hypothetical protein
MELTNLMILILLGQIPMLILMELQMLIITEIRKEDLATERELMQFRLDIKAIKS